MTGAFPELRERLTGVNALLTTPFTPNGDLDEDTLRAKVSFLVEHGVEEGSGTLIALGSVGECATLTREEQRLAIEAVVDEADGRVPVVAGANHSGTRVAITLAEQALEAGADAIMSVTPYYYPPSPESIIHHYEALADAVNGGIVLYNNFVVSDIDIPAEAIERLARREEVVAIKEPTLNTAKLDRVAEQVGDQVTVLNGNGESFEPQASLLGAQGFTTAMANYAPDLSLEIYRLGHSGKYEQLRSLRRRRVSPVSTVLGNLEPEFAPAALKYIENQLGVPGGGTVRAPHPKLPETARERIVSALETSELLRE